jgi:cell division septum initiation protein DivIVA
MSPAEVEAVSVLALVDQLEELVGSARRVPLSASVVVNEDDALELIDRIRLGLPEELLQARQRLEDSGRIVAGAEEEAERVLRRAEQEAEKLIHEAGDRATALVGKNAVTEQARDRAAALIAEAEAQAAAVRVEADAYARDVMVRLEEELFRLVSTIRKGIETLPAGEPPKRGRRKQA